MTPLTLDAAEQQLHEALTMGDPDRIATATTLVQRLLPGPRAFTMRASALWYATQGLHVFPLQVGSKIPPRGLRWRDEATNDTDRVDAWWAVEPTANIGIATGHLVDVIDIDGPTGVLSWARLDLPPVLGRVSTPRPGGNHLYVTAVEGRGNRAGIMPGVDYRGTGGYVVAPPSVNEQGEYQWHRPLDLTALEVAA